MTFWINKSVLAEKMSYIFAIYHHLYDFLRESDGMKIGRRKKPKEESVRFWVTLRR